MSRTMNWTGASLAAGAIALTGMLGTTNSAQAEAVVGSGISVNLATTWTSDYYFRGVAQENEGFIFQPEATVTFNDVLSFEVMDGESITVSPYLGVWMSLHSPTATSTGGVMSAATGGAINTNSAIFETDYIVGMDIGLPYGLGVDLSYVFYTYPGANSLFVAAGLGPINTEEIIAKIYYDATDLIAGLGLDGLGAEIYYTLAVGTKGSATIYNEIGLGLDYELDVMEDMPITLGLDFALGLSYRGVYSYVHGDDADGRHQNFGFAAVTLRAGMPLTFIPEEFGAWSVEAGVSFNFINSKIGNPAIAPSEDFKAIGYVTLGVDF